MTYPYFTEDDIRIFLEIMKDSIKTSKPPPSTNVFYTELLKLKKLTDNRKTTFLKNVVDRANGKEIRKDTIYTNLAVEKSPGQIYLFVKMLIDNHKTRLSHLPNIARMNVMKSILYSLIYHSISENTLFEQNVKDLKNYAKVNGPEYVNEIINEFKQAVTPQKLSYIMDTTHSGDVVSPDGSKVAFYNYMKNSTIVKLFYLNTNTDVVINHKDEGEDEGEDKDVVTIAFSNDGKMLAVSLLNRQIVVWNIEDPTNITRIKTYRDPYRVQSFLKFSPDGNILIFGPGMNYCYKWDIHKKINDRNPPIIITNELITNNLINIDIVTFSPNSKLLILRNMFGKLSILYNITDSTFKLIKHNEDITNVFFNLDGTIFITYTHLDDTVCIWDSTNGQNIKTIQLSGIQNVSMIPNEHKYVILTNNDEHVYDLKNGQLISEKPFSLNIDEQAFSFKYYKDNLMVAFYENNMNVFIKKDGKWLDKPWTVIEYKKFLESDASNNRLYYFGPTDKHLYMYSLETIYNYVVRPLHNTV